jgi:hypothetical protein
MVEAYLELKNILHSIELVLISTSHLVSSYSLLNGSRSVSRAGMSFSAPLRRRTPRYELNGEQSSPTAQ